MSKRGSLKAIKFVGKNWSPGCKPKKISKFKIQDEKKNEKLNLRWISICNNLNFKITAENKPKHDKIYLHFKERPNVVLEIYKKYFISCKTGNRDCKFDEFASKFK